jgi:predicted nucleotidyltransferase component of viral defense system
MFLQIQSILGDRIVLKGGAAVQFYIPVEYQRTSVDIDMIFCGTKNEIDDTIFKIEQLFEADEEFFKFRLHIP